MPWKDDIDKLTANFSTPESYALALAMIKNVPEALAHLDLFQKVFSFHLDIKPLELLIFEKSSQNHAHVRSLIVTHQVTKRLEVDPTCKPQAQEFLCGLISLFHEKKLHEDYWPPLVVKLLESKHYTLIHVCAEHLAHTTHKSIEEVWKPIGSFVGMYHSEKVNEWCQRDEKALHLFLHALAEHPEVINMCPVLKACIDKQELLGELPSVSQSATPAKPKVM